MCFLSAYAIPRTFVSQPSCTNQRRFPSGFLRYTGSCYKIEDQTDDCIAPLDNLNRTGLNFRDSFCPPGYYNDMASLSFNMMETAIHDLFHVHTEISLLTCAVFFLATFVTSCWTYGLMIPSGLFVPSLCCGAGYGRFVGELMTQLGYNCDRGTYALVGAAAFLGGNVRMTISLTVILMEATNQVGLI